MYCLDSCIFKDQICCHKKLREQLCDISCDSGIKNGSFRFRFNIVFWISLRDEYIELFDETLKLRCV